jgi:hypothetical protein
MNEQEWLAERFEANRPQLRAVAYRMLGSLSEADDASRARRARAAPRSQRRGTAPPLQAAFKRRRLCVVRKDNAPRARGGSGSSSVRDRRGFCAVYLHAQSDLLFLGRANG